MYSGMLDMVHTMLVSTCTCMNKLCNTIYMGSCSCLKHVHMCFLNWSDHFTTFVAEKGSRSGFLPLTSKSSD
jgi:hypothetical protein